MFLRVFHFLTNLLARCFPSASEALKVLQEGSKILPRASQEGPKDAQEASKRLPRGAQDGPRRSRGLTLRSKLGETMSNKCQEGSKRRFGTPFWCPRASQEASKTPSRGSQKVPQKVSKRQEIDRRRYDILGYARIRWDMLGYAGMC